MPFQIITLTEAISKAFRENTNKQSGQISVILKDSSGNEVSIIDVSTNLEGVGDLTVGTTQVEIVITGTTSSIRIRADNTNTGIIYIGKTGVLSNGTNDFVRLESGDEVIIGYNDTTNGLFAISNTAAQTINVGALL